MKSPFRAKVWKGAEVWPLDHIKPHPDNPRTHPADQVTALAGIFLEHGPDQPIVVDEDGVIIKGHGRLLAAQEAGLAEFPVFARRGLSEVDKKAIRISDNAVAERSGWIEDLLRTDLAEISLAGYDMPILGFGESELASYMAMPMVKEPDAVPPAPKIPITRPGDLWHLGPHRLICASAEETATWAALFKGAKRKANLVFTDPPLRRELPDAVRKIRRHQRRQETSRRAVRAAGQFAAPIGKARRERRCVLHLAREFNPKGFRRGHGGSRD